MKKRLKILIALIVVLIIVAIVIVVMINNASSNTVNEVDENTLEQIEQNALINKLADMTEIERVQTYFGEFLEYIEAENYEEAYNHLNESFREKYFDTIEKFSMYAKGKYPKNAYVNYNDFERQGEVYILTVTIGEVLNDDFEVFKQNIVIRENGVNEYRVSLQLEESEINNNSEPIENILTIE